MPVTKATYTVTAPWSNTQLAAAFRTAFIDSGLMTEWYDSFGTPTMENRVLEITYDATKTYGKTYYWFKFHNNQIYVHCTSGWNATNDAPTGTQYVDYYTSDVNAVTNMTQLTNQLNANVTTTITRWTSTVNPQFTWFLVRCGSITLNFHVNRAAPAAWIDLTKVFYTSMYWVRSWAGAVGGVAFPLMPFGTRRTFLGAGRGTDPNYFGASNLHTAYGRSALQCPAYHLIGNEIVFSSSSYLSAGDSNGVLLPIGYSNVNNAYTTDTNPIFSGLPLSLYSTGLLPSDFGIAGFHGSNTMGIFDQFVVTPNTEVWDIVNVTNSGWAGQGMVSAMFLARTI